MYTLSDSAAQGTSLLDFPAPAGRVVSGAFDDALESNPVPLFMLSRELNAAKEQGPKMPWWQATDQAKRAGVKVDVPEEGLTQPALSILIERRKDDAARELLFARKEGFTATAGTFGAGLAGAFMDPLNAAAGFVPVLSGTRYAAALEKAATVGSRAAVRAGVGAAEGLVGAAAVEMPTIALHRELQDDYSLYDSLANIAFGTFASAGLRVGGGAVRDHWRGIRAARQEDFIRSIEPSEWKAAQDTYQRQLEQDMDAELRGGFDRGTGPSDGLTERWAAQRKSAEISASADEAVSRMQRRMSDEEIAKFVEAEQKMRDEAKAPGADDRVLLDSAGIAERKFREMDLAEVRDRLAKGQGLIIVPGNAGEAAAAVSDETHALALKTAVAQAVEGRRIDVDPVLRQDPVFGPQRMGASAVKERAQSNMAPEAKVGADKEASTRADKTLKERPAPREKEVEGKAPELIEAEALLKDTQKLVKDAANDAGKEPPAPGAGLQKADDYEKAWKAIADCVGKTA